MHWIVWRRALACLAFLALSVLAGCGTPPGWIELPVMADGVVASGPGAYSGANADGLVLDAQHSVVLRFSTDTLPTEFWKSDIDPNTRQVSPPHRVDYMLSGDKVQSARLVLFADRVTRGGTLTVVPLTDEGGGNCWPTEDQPPGCTVEDAAAQVGQDPDVAQAVQIAEPGFYTIDITAIVKGWVDNPSRPRALLLRPSDAASGLQASFASQEGARPTVRQKHVLHQPQVLVFLDRVYGAREVADRMGALQQAQPGSTAWNSSSTTLSSTPGAQSVGIADFSGAWSGGSGQVLSMVALLAGGASSKLVGRVQPASIWGAQPELSAYWSEPLATTSSTVTDQASWTNSWADPTWRHLVGVAPLVPASGPQTVVVDLKDSLQEAMVHANGFASALPLLATNTPSPVQLQDLGGTGQPLRSAVALLDPAAQNPFAPREFPLTWTIGGTLFPVPDPSGTPARIRTANKVTRLRVGQRLDLFQSMALGTVYAALANGNALALDATILLHSSSGAAVTYGTAPSRGQYETVDFASADLLTIPAGIALFQANDSVGPYELTLSVPGVNIRARFPMENIALPTVSLTGPASLVLPASGPVAGHYEVAVDDPARQQDTSTLWALASTPSAGVTLPASATLFPRIEGSEPMDVGFAAPGAYTLKVTSFIGDSRLTSTLGVQVLAGIYPSAAAGGTVSCADSAVALGQGTTCTAVPDAGYALDAFSGCDSVSGNVCTVLGVTGSRSVSASFKTLTAFSGVTVPPVGAGGPGAARFTGGGDLCRFDLAHTGFIAPPAAPPPGQQLPQGMFQYRLIGCDTTPVTVSIDWPKPLSNLTKWGPASAGAQPSYFAPEGLAITGNTSTFTVIDGQKGDDDWAVNGTITDPVGPTSAVLPVPALDRGALLLLVLLALGLGLHGKPRIRPRA